MTEQVRPVIPMSVAGPEVSKTALILDINLSQIQNFSRRPRKVPADERCSCQLVCTEGAGASRDSW